MSFGLDIETHDVYGKPLCVDVVNGHTYNLTPMWAKALPEVIGEIGTSRALDGWCTSELIPHLDKGVVDIIANAEEYRELKPSNGRGNYEGFREIFLKFAELCHKHPSGNVKWNG